MGVLERPDLASAANSATEPATLGCSGSLSARVFYRPDNLVNQALGVLQFNNHLSHFSGLSGRVKIGGFELVKREPFVVDDGPQSLWGALKHRGDYRQSGAALGVHDFTFAGIAAASISGAVGKIR
jgi:hypothetical protein